MHFLSQNKFKLIVLAKYFIFIKIGITFDVSF
jgi:hypothetical protein